MDFELDPPAEVAPDGFPDETPWVGALFCTESNRDEPVGTAPR